MATETISTEDPFDTGCRPFTFRARDGLELFARDYGPRAGAATPVLCLAGLSRNSRDFHELALALSTDARAPRRVLCMDYRGRGRSAYDADWRNYAIPVELGDVLDLMVAAGIEHAAIVGTSRGGLIAMSMGAVRPGAIRGVVLNDVGPELAAEGLARIKSYVGKTPSLAGWEQAAQFLREMNESHFPGYAIEAWENQARKIFAARNGRIAPDYDTRLARTLEGIDLTRPLPTLWPQFESLANVPVLLFRGANSDLLTAETADRMAERHGGLDLVTVPDAGHVPFLTDSESIGRIAQFCRRLDRQA